MWWLPSQSPQEMDNNSCMNPEVKTDSHDPPKKPEEVVAWAPPYLSIPGLLHRHSFRPVISDYALLTFRVRQANYEQLLWQLFENGSVPKDHAYDPNCLPFWTIGLRVKVRSHVSMGRVMDALIYRMGLTRPGIRFCLDGFYGMRGFSDIFNNPNACPWMEISKFSTVHSLHLRHGDNIFISLASLAQINDVIEYRRKHMMNTPTQGSSASPASKESKPNKIEVLDDERGGVIGRINYGSDVHDSELLAGHITQKEG